MKKDIHLTITSRQGLASLAAPPAAPLSFVLLNLAFLRLPDPCRNLGIYVCPPPPPGLGGLIEASFVSEPLHSSSLCQEYVCLSVFLSFSFSLCLIPIYHSGFTFSCHFPEASFAWHFRSELGFRCLFMKHCIFLLPYISPHLSSLAHEVQWGPDNICLVPPDILLSRIVLVC